MGAFKKHGFRAHYILFLFSVLTLALGLGPKLAFLYADKEYKLPVDKRATYRIGVLEFSIPPEPQEAQYAGRSLPLLLLEDLQNCENHTFNETERKTYRNRLLDETIRKKRLEIDEIQEALNSLFFSGENNNKKRRELEKDLADKEDYISYLREIDLTQIKVGNTKKVEIVSHREKEQLFPLPVVSMVDLARKQSLDLIVRGRVERVENYFYLRVSIWSWSEGGEIASFETASTLENLGSNMNAYSKKVKTIVLGRPWGNLKVKADPEGADIYVDGKFWGSGTITVANLSTGTHTVSAMAKGYKTLEKAVFLWAEQILEKQLTLEKIKRKQVWIVSYPDGADLYVSSQWVGKTPLNIDFPMEEELVFLKKKGYADEKIFLEGDESIKKVYMHPLDAGTEALIDHKRDNFYTSLGLFALSIPIPLFSWGLGFQNSEGFYMAADSMNFEEMQEYKLKANRFYHAYIGGLVISGALLVNTIIHLIDYIVAGNESR